MNATTQNVSKLWPVIDRLSAFLKQQTAPLLPYGKTVVTFFQNRPNLIRAILVLPLLITWFLGIHTDKYRSTAYRGFFLTVLFVLSSWVLYLLVNFAHNLSISDFVVQLFAFCLQTCLSAGYIGYSIFLSVREYKNIKDENQFLDRLKLWLLKYI